MEHTEPLCDAIWHFENVETVLPYCRDTSQWWKGYTDTVDLRGQELTANPRFVTCVKCLKKMKKNGIKDFFTAKEMEILKKVSSENHILLPEYEEGAAACYRLARSGHITMAVGFKNEELFFETVTGNNILKAFLEVYGDDYK